VDQLALWPDDQQPTHLIACNEAGAGQPGVLRIALADGRVETILSGTTSCDPVRRTPWGTLVFAEEAGGGPAGGRVYELLDPLHTTGVRLDRNTGTFSGGEGATNLVARPALGRLSFEGIAIFRNGLMYVSDERGPDEGGAGGAYFKFIPANPWTSNATGTISSLNDSPLVSGRLYGLRVGTGGPAAESGQGAGYGPGTWVPIPGVVDPDLPAQATTLELSGYYRPEDADVDLAASARGQVRFCGSHSGNEAQLQRWGEVACISDGSVEEAMRNAGQPQVEVFVAGTSELNMPDNIAYQPVRGNWIVHEDGDTQFQQPHNNDLWSCLPDGRDVDVRSDGCIRVATLNDLTAEWTGGIFDGSGKHFYVSVQHNISGSGTVLDISGWE
ncbi:MAG TPA: alkaline phosphatase PhoX, partial [Chloroflexota bacterium]|nr:alkaline phosphatase PhoX [Chloroflexota bacterium]